MYLTGLTFSPDLPASPGAAGPIFKGPAGYSDAFVAKFSALPNAPVTDTGADVAALRLTLRPGRIRAGRRVPVRFRCTVLRAGRQVPVAGATIRAAGRRARTDRTGRATLGIRFATPGRRSVRRPNADTLVPPARCG